MEKKRLFQILSRADRRDVIVLEKELQQKIKVYLSMKIC